MDPFTRSFLMLFVRLNPFILRIYLLEVATALEFRASCGAWRVGWSSWRPSRKLRTRFDTLRR